MLFFPDSEDLLMASSRIIENQRRNALSLVQSLSRRLTPGVPFATELRGKLALNPAFGSRDRRIYREIVFTWLRFRAWFDRTLAIDRERAADLLVALSPATPEMESLQAALPVPGAIPIRTWPELRERLAALVPGVEFELRALLPPWFEAQCPELFSEEETLVQLTRPPLWLRAQRGTAAELVRELKQSGIEAGASPIVAGAVRLGEYADLEKHPLIVSGRAEVQDIGSQALLTMTAPEPGGRWLDFCAGAGGKTLQLAAMLGTGGRVTAYDPRRDALIELKRRLMRAEARNITIEHILPEAGPVQFAGVLVDAPCSGSGTWRRHPFLRHQTGATTIARLANEQAGILRRAASYVGPDGRLIYATCSLSRRENEDVVRAFLDSDTRFVWERTRVLPGLPQAESIGVTLMPSLLDSDGYFLACLRRRW